MTTQTYLRQVTQIDAIIKNKIEEINRWREIATSFGCRGINPDKVQSTPNPQRMSDAIVKVFMLEAECEDKLKRLVETKQTIISQIETIGTKNGYSLLYGVFVENKTLMDLADDRSERQIRRYFTEALNEFEQKYGYMYLSV